MRVAPTSPLGAVVDEIALAEVGPLEVDRLRALLATHGVLAFPGQGLDDRAFIDFLSSFGSLAFTKGEAHVPGAPELNVVTNVGRKAPPRSSFHVDTSYVRRPPAYTALRAVEIPSAGGETVFSDQYRALDTLPKDLREDLRGRTITHVVSGVELEEGDEAEAEHPIIRPHPLTGRAALYLTTPARCAAISGMGDLEAAATIEFLFEHSTRPDNLVRHRWEPGDVVMWDNACVLHRADHSGVVGDRTMHRGMVAGHGPEAAAAASRR
jgi:taurine dioxygenase